MFSLTLESLGSLLSKKRIAPKAWWLSRRGEGTLELEPGRDYMTTTEYHSSPWNTNMLSVDYSFFCLHLNQHYLGK